MMALTPDIPMPGDYVDNSTVIASVTHSETDQGEWYTLLLLNAQAPYYRVGIGHWVDGAWRWDESGCTAHRNIVFAVNGDDFPNPAPNHAMTGPRADGYTDMGGEV